MRVVVFLFCLVLFLGSFFLFGYGIGAPHGLDYLLVSLGIVAVSLAIFIPFHVLEKFD